MTLEQWRQRVCLSRGELARKAEIAPLTVWRIERGKSVPVCLTRRQIAAALGVDHAAIAWPKQKTISSSH